jgi:hypothetical protein
VAASAFRLVKRVLDIRVVPEYNTGRLRVKGRVMDPLALKRVELALHPDDVAYLDKLGESEGRTRGDLIRDALRDHFPQLYQNERKRRHLVLASPS